MEGGRGGLRLILAPRGRVLRSGILLLSWEGEWMWEGDHPLWAEEVAA